MCVAHCISSGQHYSLANAMMTKEMNGMNTEKGDTKSQLSADNWLSDKKII